MNISDLIKKYEKDRDFYRSSKYHEAQLRIDFLDPFLSLLGWDIQNLQGKTTNEREVLVEESIKENKFASSKKPDYTFRLYSEKKFYFEAKKPSIDINNDPQWAHQVRRYGFTSKLKISILSNFEYLAIYETSQAVNETDTVTDYRITIYHYTEYVHKFDQINKYIGRESVYTGNFDHEWSHIENKIRNFSVDNLFLKQINEWRINLSYQFLKLVPNIEEAELNDLTQSYINSLIFLRVCEDRNLETYQTLLSFSKKKDRVSFVNNLKKADKKYNSGLFKLNYIVEILSINNSSIWEIIEQLYYPKSPYSFSVFSSDILGNIYEIFLGETIVINCGKVSLKPINESVNRDIVTTPIFIIRNIIKNTVEKFCKNKTDTEIFNSKFGDIACGSGAFLLEIFQYLQDFLIDYYIKNDESNLQKISINTYKLKYHIKQRLLVSCIYGVDKDYNAVKACHFGLLLKLLEGEDNSTISLPALPLLEKNIYFGNSLITPAMCENKADLFEINPFQFGLLTFDVIVGNPPYMATEDIKKLTPKELILYKKHYKTAYKQFDKYFLFIEQAIKLLNKDGYLGYIIPSKFMKVGAGKNLRKMLSENNLVSEIVSFGANQVFDNKTTYTCLLTLSKKENPYIFHTNVRSLLPWILRNDSKIETNKIEKSSLTSDVWVIDAEIQYLLEKINRKTIPLEELLGKNNIENGIQTSANKEYIHEIENEDNNYIYFNYENKIYKVEKEVTRPYYKTNKNSDLFHTYNKFKPNSFVIYPYKKINNKIELISYNELKISFPFLFSYFNDIRSKLDNSKRDIKPKPSSSDEWYCYGRHQSLENCDVNEKIIVGILSKGYKYSVDHYKTFISSGGTAGYCLINLPQDSNYSIYYIQALLTSKYLEWFAFVYGEIFRGGFVARGTKVLKRMPVVPINFNNIEEVMIHDEIVKLQEELINDYTLISSNNISDRDKEILIRKFNDNKDYLDTIIEKLYGLGGDDSSIPTVEKLYSMIER